jgi:hypothetical protein
MEEFRIFIFGRKKNWKAHVSPGGLAGRIRKLLNSLLYRSLGANYFVHL